MEGGARPRRAWGACGPGPSSCAVCGERECERTRGQVELPKPKTTLFFLHPLYFLYSVLDEFEGYCFLVVFLACMVVCVGYF
jgi:hypothetical protein